MTFLYDDDCDIYSNNKHIIYVLIIDQIKCGGYSYCFKHMINSTPIMFLEAQFNEASVQKPDFNKLKANLKTRIIKERSRFGEKDFF